MRNLHPDADGLAASGAAAATASDTLVVYTAITAGYDDLTDPPPAARQGSRFVAFLEEPNRSAVWQARPIHTEFADPVRNAKIHKILPHRYFPQAEYSLWIDGSVTILADRPLADLVGSLLRDADLVVFRHKQRTCVYQEAVQCMERRLDDLEVMWQQVCRYTVAGYPHNAGLGECPVILRRHSDAVRDFNEAWWEEIRRGSRRDQLSFDYVARRLGLRYGVFPGTIRANPLFSRHPHKTPRRTDAPDYTPPPQQVYYRAARPRRTIAFGPISRWPSWGWTGFDVARALSRWYDVALFDRAAAPPPCDVAVLIKWRPDEAFVDAARRRGTRLVYCPIDAYESAEQLAADAPFLRQCALVIAHSERLLPPLRRLGVRAEFAEHHARFALPEPAPFRRAGFLLWIGGCQYLPYLVHWLETHPIGHEVRILTNLDNPNALAHARANAAAIGAEFALPSDAREVAGASIHRWTERRQQEMLSACRAGLDVKYTALFQQFHKPPTKAQKFVASGIPFAANADSYSAEYFLTRGFALAEPTDTERWLSRPYWEETRAAATVLRAATSLDAVAARYRALIESL